MLFDFLDPEQMAEVENGNVMPAELEALTLRNLRVAAAGAELTGTGDFTFDNTDLNRLAVSILVCLAATV